MPCHFKKAERTERAMRRACRAHIETALALLEKSRHPAAIHGVRKEIKNLRAILRLVREQIDRSDYRITAKALRKAADQLAAPRDASVTLKALEKLAGVTAARRFPTIRKILQTNCHRKTQRFRADDSVAKAKRMLQKVNRRVARLEVKGNGWEAIEPGVRLSYQRGQRACARARQQPAPENFHDWRKHVKHLWYHLKLLCRQWPVETGAMMAKLDLLGELLGDDHDLMLLEQFVATHCAEQRAEAATLNRLIATRQHRIRAAALKLGSRLYKKTPTVVCARLGSHWNAWREGSS